MSSTPFNDVSLAKGCSAVAPRQDILSRVRARLGAWLLGGFVCGYLVWSLGPALIAVLFSFNSGRSRSVWQGFSTQWWTGASDSVLHNPVYRAALEQSFKLAVLDVVIAVPLGVALAVFLGRWKGIGARPVSLLTSLPLVVPELVLAVSLFVLTTSIAKFVPLGTTGQVVGQVTFSLPFVVVITRGRLSAIAIDYEEAALDLGASPFKAFALALAPLLQPAIVASMIVTFAISIDDFVLAQYMSAAQATQTVPMLIYNNARGQATPALNATATVLVVVTLLGVGLGLLAYRATARRESLTMSTADTSTETETVGIDDLQARVTGL
jgi:spermidine/putrescine transport system permease protein